MANIKSIQKVLKFLDSNGEVLTISDIVLGVHLTPKSVKEILELLRSDGRVGIVSNGKVTFVIKLGEKQNATA